MELEHVDRALARRLAVIRTATGYSQATLAAESARYLAKPWTQNTVYQVERGQRRLWVSELLMLSRVFGQPLSFFLDDLKLDEQPLEPPRRVVDEETVKRQADQLVLLLARGVRANGYNAVPRPVWRDNARRMITLDGHPFEEIQAVMEWALRDPFWKQNIRSFPKFRQQYDRLLPRWREERDRYDGSAATVREVDAAWDV